MARGWPPLPNKKCLCKRAKHAGYTRCRLNLWMARSIRASRSANAGCEIMAAMASRAARHVLVLVAFAAMTTAWLWPFLASPASRIPGDAGDNFLFVWNLWWVRHAVQARVWPLWCPAIFVPYGVDLTLHTLTPLPALVVALLSPRGSVLAGTNAIIAAHLYLNFAAAYALAWRLTRSYSAAIVGACVFAWSPYMDVRLLGHFNLIAGWTLALTALLTFEMLERRSAMSALSLALAVAATAYVEYYYVVYAAALAVLLACARITCASWRVSIDGGIQRRVLLAIAAGAALGCLVAIAITLSGGFVFNIGGLSVSLKSGHNPMAAASALVMLGLIVAIAPSSVVTFNRDDFRRCLPPMSIAFIAAAVLVSPLLIAGVRVWLHGDYVSQTYLWRSAPAGVDAATLLLGNPRGLLWRGLPVTAYRSLGIDAIEQVAWLSPGVICLCVAAVRRRVDLPQIRTWAAVGTVFGVWALGPSLAAFGRSLPIVLPATLLRYVPIVSNARIPGRAMAPAYLAVAMLAACGFLLLRQRGHTWWAVACASLTLADLVPARPPILNVDRPGVYDVLRIQGQSGAVCELPLGLRDSFGVTGQFDPWMLWHQTIHERPMAGGFVSRLPPRIPRGYLGAPVLGSFLRLSAGGSLDAEPPVSADAAAAALQSDGIAFIVMDRHHSSAALLEYVRRLNLPRVADDGERELLRVERRSAADDRVSR
jgi:hypothetical protein